MKKQRTFDNSLVKKAWGSEWRLYSNENLAIWALSIDKGKRTSFHSHPNKLTGLIVIDGMAKVQFINNSITLKALDKLAIFPRRFHSTEALSNNCLVLEVESPEDKLDLVRLSDDYGRVDQGYETEENYLPLTDFHKTIPNTLYHDTTLGKCHLTIFEPRHIKELGAWEFEDVFVFLRGGLETKDNKVVVAPGDVVSASNLDLLIKKFLMKPETLVMLINKPC